MYTMKYQYHGGSPFHHHHYYHYYHYYYHYYHGLVL